MEVRPFIPRRVVRAVGLFVAAFLSVSLATSTMTTAQSTSIVQKSGGTVKVGIFDTFPGFCVGNNPANSALMATRTIYETLFEKTRGNDMIGLLAKTAYPSADLKTWTIVLRPGISFSNGQPFNADAVIENINYNRGLAYLAAAAVGQGATKAYTLGTAVAFDANILSAVKVDDLTVSVTLFKAQNDLPTTLYASGRAFMRAPEQLENATKCAQNPIGTGPFTLKTWDQDNLDVVRNPNYWRTDPNKPSVKLPYLDEIKFTNVKEGSQRAASVRKGALDAAMFSGGTEATFIKDLRQRKSVVTEYKSPSEYYPSLWLNQDTSSEPGTPFASLNARLAVASCIDRVNYVKVRTKNESQPAISIVGPNSVMFSRTGFTSFNVARAKKFVTAYKAETGKGALTFSAPADTTTTSQANMKFLQSQFSKCGIKMNVVVEETAVIIAKAFNGNTGKNGYDAILITLLEGTDVGFNAPFLLTNSFPSDTTNPAKAFTTSLGTVLNLSHHSDGAVDANIYNGRAAGSVGSAKQSYRLATAEIQRQALLTTLNYFYYDLVAYKKSNLLGIGQLQIEKGKTQRIVTNWGIDWTGVSKG